MTLPPRDSKGRFCKKRDDALKTEPLFNTYAIIIVLVGFAAIATSYTVGHIFGYDSGYASGLTDGHAKGVAEQQPVVFKDGFAKGQEFERDWKLADDYLQHTLYGGNHLVCKQVDPDDCNVVDANYNTRFPIYFPNWSRV